MSLPSDERIADIIHQLDLLSNNEASISPASDSSNSGASHGSAPEQDDHRGEQSSASNDDNLSSAPEVVGLEPKCLVGRTLIYTAVGSETILLNFSDRTRFEIKLNGTDSWSHDQNAEPKLCLTWLLGEVLRITSGTKVLAATVADKTSIVWDPSADSTGPHEEKHQILGLQLGGDGSG